MTFSVPDLLTAGRLQEAEWLMRRGASTPLTICELAERLQTQLSPAKFYVSPGYYAPLPNWAEAERCCGDAYQASSVVERYRRQLQSKPSPLIGAYTIRQLAALQHAWLELGQPSQLRVLDFGGALGSHFHALEPYWPWCRLLWTVCETPAVATAGTAEFECVRPNGTTLHFTDQAAEVVSAGIDLVFASCSLQYLEHWQSILQLFRAARWLLLDRVPLVDHPSDLISIQVVPASYTDTRYPGWMFSAPTWLPRLQRAGFFPALRWLVPEDYWTILDLETGKLRWGAQHDHGFLLKSDLNHPNVSTVF